jgi:NADH dehydrogenase
MATIGRRAAVAELPRFPPLRGMVAWIAWLVLHLVYLMGMRNRISVFVNWAWNYFTWDRGPRLIFAGADQERTPDAEPR